MWHVTLGLDPAPLRRAAAVVRNRGHVLNGADLQARSLQRANRSLTARSGAANEHVDLSHSVLLSLPRSLLCGYLSGERSTFSAALEVGIARAGPRYGVALRVRDGHQRVVEGRVNVRHSTWDVL